MDIREQYEKETGLKATEHITDGIHSVPAIEVFSFEYVEWLEQFAINHQSDLSLEMKNFIV